MVGKLFASGLITQDGETIDGEGREGIIVLGKVPAAIMDATSAGRRSECAKMCATGTRSTKKYRKTPRIHPMGKICLAVCF